MSGIMRNGQAYASQVSIDDTTISSSKTWSSEKISKINVSDAKKVDAKPTYANGTITYVKDGSSYTTTNTKQWFYYLDNGSLKQTIFIDGEELTIDGASVDFDEYVKKTSITDTIDTTSTSTDIASAKGVYDELSVRNIKTYTTVEQLGLASGCTVEDIYLALPNNSYFECSVANSNTTSGYTKVLNTPTTDGLLYIRKNPNGGNRFSLEFKVCATGVLYPNELYIGTLKGNDASGLTWNRVCSTKVDNVPVTDITLDSSIASIPSSNDFARYYVQDGWCHVVIKGLELTNTGSYTIMSDFPQPLTSYDVNIIQIDSNLAVPTKPAFIYVVNKSLKIISYTSTGPFWGTLHYKVSES